MADEHRPLSAASTPPDVLASAAQFAVVPKKPLSSKPPATVASRLRTVADFTPASTYRGNLLVEDSHWRGKVLLDGWVTVAPQATLFIHPGTLIRVADGGGILVHGRLVLKGEPESPIVVTSVYTQSLPSDWQGIFFSGTEKNNTFEHVRIEGGETSINARYSSFSAKKLSINSSAVGVRLQSGVASIRASSFTGRDVGIVVVNSELELDSVSVEGLDRGIVATASALQASDLLLTGSSATGISAEQSKLKIERLSAIGNETGAVLKKCEGSIIGSTFRVNRGTGAIVTSSQVKMTGNLFTGNAIGLQLDDTQSAVWGSAFYSNRSYDLLYLGEENLFFGGNWFGGNTAAELESSVSSKRPGAVRLAPILTANPLTLK